MTNTEQMREAFERWASDNGYHLQREEENHDRYHAWVTNTMWIGWQAALTAPAAEVPEAMGVVAAAMLNDQEYAWAWHCNIAMAAHDEGLSHYAANKAAARFLRVLVPGLDTSKHPGFPAEPEVPEAMALILDKRIRGEA